MTLADQGFLALGRMRLEYRMIGPRPDAAATLVLLHEGLGCVAGWGSFAQELAAATGAGVFAYSRAGYGNSSRLSTDGELVLTPIGVKSGELPDQTKPLKHGVKELVTGKKYPDIELPAPTLYQATLDNHLREVAVACGHHLLARRTQAASGHRVWNTGHGARPRSGSRALPQRNRRARGRAG